MLFLDHREIPTVVCCSNADQKRDVIVNQPRNTTSRRHRNKLICIFDIKYTTIFDCRSLIFFNRLSWNFGLPYNIPLATHNVNLSNTEKCSKYNNRLTSIPPMPCNRLMLNGKVLPILLLNVQGMRYKIHKCYFSLYFFMF